MKKIEIISRHAVPNYGSFLQALSLQLVVEKLGYKAEHVDYVNKLEKSYNICLLNLKQSDWNNTIMHKIIFLLCHIPNQFIMYHRFKHFRKKYLKQSRKEFTSNEQLVNEYPIADIYCTGSDQVWNTIHENKIDEMYFLKFVPNNKPKISYAASFGRATINARDKEVIKKLLEQYNAISVREDSGVNILNSFGLDGHQVLDPTLLISRGEWKTYIGDSVPKTPFILLYQIHPNEKLAQYAYNYSKKYGYELIRIGVSYTKFLGPAKYLYLPSIEKVLWCFMHSHCVVTDSFHATAFSINLNTQFITMLPDLSASRNRSLLKLFNLEKRIIINENDFSIPEASINYEKVNQILNIQRKHSIDWLSNTIENCLS